MDMRVSRAVLRLSLIHIWFSLFLLPERDVVKLRAVVIELAVFVLIPVSYTHLLGRPEFPLARVPLTTRARA